MGLKEFEYHIAVWIKYGEPWFPRGYFNFKWLHNLTDADYQAFIKSHPNVLSLNGDTLSFTEEFVRKVMDRRQPTRNTDSQNFQGIKHTSTTTFETGTRYHPPKLTQNKIFSCLSQDEQDLRRRKQPLRVARRLSRNFHID